MKKFIKPSLKITNFNKYSTFFIGIQNYNAYIETESSKNILLPKEEELSSLKSEIEKYTTQIKINNDTKDKEDIIIKEQYINPIKKYFKQIQLIKNVYSERIKVIIKELKNQGIKISLKNIQKIYKDKYNSTISLMTISRILRHKLKYRFIKTSIKNPLLNENKYKFMLAVFIKVILRSIRQGIKLLFIDESGLQLSNNNYYSWIQKDEILIGGAKNKLNERLNLVLGINDEKVIHMLLTYDNINSEKMIEFFKELIKKINDSKNDYLLIMDNAKYHLNEEIKKLILNNKMKVLLNCPYYSMFNAIEYQFRSLKCFLYKNLIKNSRELKQKTLDFLMSKDNQNTIRKIYLKELNIYLDYAIEHANDNLNTIYDGI